VVGGEQEIAAAVEAHRAWIAEEVLATELVFVADDASGDATRQLQAIDLDGITARVAITRIE
jgi:hypothetical protein